MVCLIGTVLIPGPNAPPPVPEPKTDPKPDPKPDPKLELELELELESEAEPVLPFTFFPFLPNLPLEGVPEKALEGMILLLAVSLN